MEGEGSGGRNWHSKDAGRGLKKHRVTRKLLKALLRIFKEHIESMGVLQGGAA